MSLTGRVVTTAISTDFSCQSKTLTEVNTSRSVSNIGTLGTTILLMGTPSKTLPRSHLGPTAPWTNFGPFYLSPWYMSLATQPCSLARLLDGVSVHYSECNATLQGSCPAMLTATAILVDSKCQILTGPTAYGWQCVSQLASVSPTTATQNAGSCLSCITMTQCARPCFNYLQSPTDSFAFYITAMWLQNYDWSTGRPQLISPDTPMSGI